jgi:hypothetical protein
LVLGNDVGIVADDGLNLELFLHIIFLLLDFVLDKVAPQFSFDLYDSHLQLQILDLLLFDLKDLLCCQ